ncbi:MAG TPA: hypothetical protein VGN72_01095 [Tepidisphaeraceae bacterium]|jgi:hypothetical protein|nr:hypothetical protein [Tepidisphaeraceae bacterium]
MALTPIRATTGEADFTLTEEGGGGTPVSYANIVRGVTFRQEASEENENVYANEASGGDFSLGTPITRATVRYQLKYGAAATAPFYPIEDFQNRGFVKTFAVGCSISGTITFTSSQISDDSGVSRREGNEATARLNGAQVFAWDEGTP